MRTVALEATLEGLRCDQLSELQRRAMTPRDEGRVAWQRTCSHSDRLARSSD